jgi:hypothetical protein
MNREELDKILEKKGYYTQKKASVESTKDTPLPPTVIPKNYHSSYKVYNRRGKGDNVYQSNDRNTLYKTKSTKYDPNDYNEKER